MKNILCFFIVIASVLVSCSDNDNTTTTQLPSLTGEWKIAQKMFLGLEVQMNECQMTEKLEFDSQGNYFYTYLQDAQASPCQQTISNGTYELVNNTLTWRVPETAQVRVVWQVIQFDDQTLTLYSNADGMPIQNKYTRVTD